jgi:transposase
LGVMDRLVLSDAAWERMAPLIIGRPDHKGSTGRDNRMFVGEMLWIVRTGSPWRDLLEAFGDWNSAFRRFSRWSIKGVWWRIFEAMSDDPDFEYLIVDSTIVRAHQHAAGAKKGGLKIKRSGARAVARFGMSRAVHAHRRPEGRCTTSRHIDRGIARRGRHGRYGLRRGSLAPSHRSQGRARRHPQQPLASPQISARQTSLCPAPSRGMLLQQA